MPTSTAATRGLFALVLASLTGWSPAAYAAWPKGPAQPLRCASDGLCMSATEDASLVGAFHQGGQELQFEALYRPYTISPGEVPYNYPDYCVRLTRPDGEVYDTKYGNPGCLNMWMPDYREPYTPEERDASFRRISEDGDIVYGARAAADSAVPPVGREEAWAEVIFLFDHFADMVDFHNGRNQ